MFRELFGFSDSSKEIILCGKIMTPESLEVLDDAIKILGPAIITGLVAYYIARIQSVARLKELEKTNEFKAREHFFLHQKESQATASAAGEKLVSDLQKVKLRFHQGCSDSDRETASFYLRHTLEVSEAFEQSMRQAGLVETERFRGLMTAKDRVQEISNKEREALNQNDVEHMFELAQQIDLCAHFLAEENLKGWFEKYLS
jgi:DNA-binding transcriptional regulator YhcF (GntR family)